MASPYRENQEQRQLPFQVYGPYIIWDDSMMRAQDIAGIRVEAITKTGNREKWKWVPTGKDRWTIIIKGSITSDRCTLAFTTKSKLFSLKEFADALQEALRNDPTVSSLEQKLVVK